MMVHLLRDDRDARHESERLGEIPEPESPRDRIAFGLVRPVREAGEQRGARRLIEFLDHRFFSRWRSEEHTSELQSLMRISYAVFCLKKKRKTTRLNTSQSCTAHLQNTP